MHPQKTSWWHEQIVDWELMNPSGLLGECAEHFGVTQSWLSTVRSSDAFREFRARRMAEHQLLVSQDVIDKVEELAHVSLDTLRGRIADERKDISLGIVRESAEMALKALGYGNARGARNDAPLVEVKVVSVERLEEARALMRERRQLVPVDEEESTEQPPVLVTNP